MPESLTSRLALEVSRSGVESSSVLRVLTFADARLLAEPADLTMLAVPCRGTVGDGFGGFFVWDAASVSADDNSNTLKIADVTTGRWVRLSVSGGATITPAYAGLYREVNITNVGSADGTYRDVTGWTGTTVTASGATVDATAGTITIAATGTYIVSYLCTPGYDSSSAVDSLRLRVVNNGVLVNGTHLQSFETLMVGCAIPVALTATNVLKLQVGAISAGKQMRITQGPFGVHRIA